MGILTAMMPNKSSYRLFVVHIIFVLLGIIPCGAVAQESLKHTVEAAFLFKFGRFVEWPATAFASATSPFNLCIVGEDPFGSTLDKVVKGETINGRTIYIHRLKKIERNSDCHILYIGDSGEQSLTRIVNDTRGSHVLTVSNANESESEAVIIGFVIANNRVRFDINDEAAARNNLVISSRLLNLALSVKPRKTGETR